MEIRQALQLLGVDSNVTVTELRTAFSKMSKQYHPEENPQMYSRIYEAYKVVQEWIKTGRQEIQYQFDSPPDNGNETGIESGIKVEADQGIVDPGIKEENDQGIEVGTEQFQFAHIEENDFETEQSETGQGAEIDLEYSFENIPNVQDAHLDFNKIDAEPEQVDGGRGQEKPVGEKKRIRKGYLAYVLLFFIEIMIYNNTEVSFISKIGIMCVIAVILIFLYLLYRLMRRKHRASSAMFYSSMLGIVFMFGGAFLNDGRGSPELFTIFSIFTAIMVFSAAVSFVWAVISAIIRAVRYK